MGMRPGIGVGQQAKIFLAAVRLLNVQCGPVLIWGGGSGFRGLGGIEAGEFGVLGLKGKNRFNPLSLLCISLAPSAQCADC